MIRTNTVKLTAIPAIAYRVKMPIGGAGITIIRPDEKQPGLATISKTSGKAILSSNTNKKKYPEKAFQEAIELTAGLPYRKQGSVRASEALEAVPSEEPAPVLEEEVIIDSADYQKIVDAYTDKNGKLSYTLMNKDFIKFAKSSSIVRKMVEDRKSAASIRNYVISHKLINITGNQKLKSKELKKIVEMLDEVSPKGVYKELNAEIRKMLSK